MECEYCSAEIYGRKRRFCDKKCRDKSSKNKPRHSKKCEKCGEQFMCVSHRQMFCSILCRARARVVDKTHVCTFCGSIFTPTKGTKRSGKYCSRECCFKHKSVKRVIRKFGEEFLRLRNTLKCDVCGEEFIRNGKQRRCSRDCGKEAARRRALKPIRARGCIDCGKACRKVDRCYSQYCYTCRDIRRTISKRLCGRKAKAIRRARKRNVKCESFNPHEVFVRDGWRCGVCGKKCKRNAVVPDPMAPTLDHIIPLSKGGEHTMRNTQCCHFICNSIKCDNSGAQLRLFG